MLDYNYIFRQMNGRLLPLNFIKLFTQKKNGIIPANMKVIAVVVLYLRQLVAEYSS